MKFHAATMYPLLLFMVTSVAERGTSTPLIRNQRVTTVVAPPVAVSCAENWRL